VKEAQLAGCFSCQKEHPPRRTTPSAPELAATPSQPMMAAKGNDFNNTLFRVFKQSLNCGELCSMALNLYRVGFFLFAKSKRCIFVVFFTTRFPQ
jgi:hypothetical protein